jgi:hypothetical protein
MRLREWMQFITNKARPGLVKSTDGYAKYVTHHASERAVRPEKPRLRLRPTGTYGGACQYCGTELTVTLNPGNTEARCPECFRSTETATFCRRELLI